MKLLNCFRRAVCQSLLVLTCWAGISAAHEAVDSSIGRYDALIKEQPNQSVLYLKRGELHRENKHWQLAWADYQQAQRLPASREQQHEILFCMGRMQLQSGHPDQALPLLQQVLEANPGYIRVRLNLARAYLALNQPEQAVRQMDIYISLLKRPSPDVYLERARMAQTLGPESYQQVVRGLEEGVNALGPIVTLLAELIDVHLQHGNTDTALAGFEQLPPVIKSLPKWQAKKGDIYMQAGNLEAALRTYEKALEIISELPARRQSTPAMRDLEKYLCTRLNNCRVNK